MKTSKDLTSYIENNEIEAELLDLESSVRTVEEAANALGIDEDQIIKSLLFKTDKDPMLIIISGKYKVSRNKIKKELNTQSCELASPSLVKDMTDYPVGSVPPIGLDLPKLVDNGVVQKEYVYGGGGSEHHLLKIPPSEVLIGNKTLIADIKK